jgi:hypothetical protein
VVVPLTGTEIVIEVHIGAHSLSGIDRSTLFIEGLYVVCSFPATVRFSEGSITK